MPKIMDSYMLGVFGGVPVYAETCSERNIAGVTYLARIVECPSGACDKVAMLVEGLENPSMAETARSSLAASYRRNH